MKLEFERHAGCMLCPRHKTCKEVGLPSRVGDVSGNGLPSAPALFVVGEKPGWFEDREGRIFVSDSGEALRDSYLGSMQLGDVFSAIYYGNAVRCYAPGAKTAQGAINQCRRHLAQDIEMLLGLHDTLYILCVGSPATQAVVGMKLKQAFKVQGTGLPRLFWLGYPKARKKKGEAIAAPISVPDEVCPPGSDSIRVWCTYHPASLRSERNPSYDRAVYNHLLMLRRSVASQAVPGTDGSVDLTTAAIPPILQEVKWTKPGTRHVVPRLQETIL